MEPESNAQEMRDQIDQMEGLTKEVSKALYELTDILEQTEDKYYVQLRQHYEFVAVLAEKLQIPFIDDKGKSKSVDQMESEIYGRIQWMGVDE